MGKIKVLNKEITVYTQNEEDYICITDIARYKNPDRTDDLIRNWLRNRNTIEFLGIWEHLNNPDFKPVEFDGFRKQAGLNSFTLTPGQWIEKTQGCESVAGKHSMKLTNNEKQEILKRTTILPASAKWLRVARVQ
jgi:hypothetical protein